MYVHLQSSQSNKGVIKVIQSRPFVLSRAYEEKRACNYYLSENKWAGSYI